MANVSIIPATKRSVQNGGQLKMQNNIRVAAYCRVSTGDESQQTSYTTQKAFYTSFITSKPGWRFAGIYADEALSGTSRAHRVEFNRMMDDAPYKVYGFSIQYRRYLTMAAKRERKDAV